MERSPRAAIRHKLSSPPCPLRPLCPPAPPKSSRNEKNLADSSTAALGCVFFVALAYLSSVIAIILCGRAALGCVFCVALADITQLALSRKAQRQFHIEPGLY